MKPLNIGLFVIVALAGFTVGITARDIKGVKLKNDISVAELGSIVATLGVGVVIPIVFSKWLESNKAVRGVLLEECENAISEVKAVRTKFLDCYVSSTVTQADKNEINALFSIADNTIDNLADSIKDVFKKKLSKNLHEAKMAYIAYWRVVTGGPLMGASFVTIDTAFYEAQARAWADFEHKLKVVQYKALTL